MVLWVAIPELLAGCSALPERCYAFATVPIGDLTSCRFAVSDGNEGVARACRHIVRSAAATRKMPHCLLLSARNMRGFRARVFLSNGASLRFSLCSSHLHKIWELATAEIQRRAGSKSEDWSRVTVETVLMNHIAVRKRAATAGISEV